MAKTPDITYKIPTAVIGCGHWGKNLVRNFSELGVLAALCEGDNARATELSEHYNVPALTMDEIATNPEIQAVAIATPAATHADVAEKMLNAGKHVFVEKPLAVNVEDAERLCALQKKYDKTLMVGHLLQYHSAFLKLREMAEAGDLGRLRYIYSNRLNLGKIRREEDILWSFAPHDISMILSLFNQEPKEVTASGGYYLHPTIADMTTTHLSFPCGGKAHIFVSWLHPYKQQQLVVVGDEGMIVFDDGKPWAEKLALYRHKINWQQGMPIPSKSECEYVDLPENEPLKQECAHFLESIATGVAPRTDAAEGLRVLKVLDLAATDLKNQITPANDTANNAANVAAPSEPAQSTADEGDVFIHPTAEVDVSASIGKGTKIWHQGQVLSHAVIGENCILGKNVMVGKGVVIGNGCKVQNNVSVYSGVTLEDTVFCGPSCVFTNVSTPRAHIDRKDEYLPTHVGEGATIGANATIVCGNDLGAYCLIGAGAVVTKTVKPHALMVGNPAVQKGWVSHAGEVLDETLTCPKDGRQYDIVNDNLVEVETTHDRTTAKRSAAPNT